MTILPNCDCCGRFTVPGAPGSSWVMVPAIDVPGWSYGDERERCPRCTEKHGPAMPSRGPDEVRYDMVCGMVTPNAEAQPASCPRGDSDE